jgi:hypothetical protein
MGFMGERAVLYSHVDMEPLLIFAMPVGVRPTEEEEYVFRLYIDPGAVEASESEEGEPVSVSKVLEVLVRVKLVYVPLGNIVPMFFVMTNDERLIFTPDQIWDIKDAVVRSMQRKATEGQ